MTLGWALSNAPDEFRADLQQYYGLNLDDMGSAYTVYHAACLAEQMPLGSRLAGKLDPRAAWDEKTRLLHSLEYTNRVLVWSKTKDAQRNSNRPKPLKEPGSKSNASVESIIEGKDVVKAAFNLKGV